MSDVRRAAGGGVTRVVRSFVRFGASRAGRRRSTGAFLRFVSPTSSHLLSLPALRLCREAFRGRERSGPVPALSAFEQHDARGASSYER